MRAEFLPTFVEVVRAGSFSGAARKRAMTPSAIVRQIDALEGELGVALFRRSTRALLLTDAGIKLYERALKLLDDLADTHAEVAAFDGTVSGRLRIACLPTFGKRYIVPVVASLQARHPSLKIDLELTERLADPAVERFDLVVRMGELPNSSLIGTKIAQMRRALVASPDYLTNAGRPDTADDLAKHQLIDKLHGADLLGWTDVIGSPAGSSAPDNVVFRSDDFEALRGAAIADMGIVFLPTWVVGPDIRKGILTELLSDTAPWNDNPVGIYLLRVLPRPSAKVRVFSDALIASIGQPPIWEPDHIS